jgi:peptidoglycan hydrolase-like protein with peptidoglycan-binding domain
MKITHTLMVTGLAAALGLGVACEKRTADDNMAPRTPPSSTTPSPSASPTATPTSPPTASSDKGMESSSDKQPVSGVSLSYTTDDGKKQEIHDTVAITQIQQKLAKEGLYSGATDGHSSPELTTALRRFQARNGLNDTAVIDHATANKLGLDWNVLTKQNVRDEVQKGANDIKDDAKDLGKKMDDKANDVSKEIKSDAEKAKDKAKDMSK